MFVSSIYGGTMNKIQILISVLIISSSIFAQDFDKVEIKTHKVTDSIYMLEGAGGNIGVCIGEDGVFLIDDQYAPLTEKIKTAIAQLTDKPIKFLINTHWHGDHVGGNEKIGDAGAVIVAHENVRKRMSTEQVMKAFNRTVPPSPKIALPVITFTRDLKFHFNGEEIEVTHAAHAHTDGDAIIHFKKANVVHTGDLYFNGMYPFIDAGSAGSVDGVISATNQLHSKINDNTKIIPGHGPLSDTAAFQKYRLMLKTIRDRIKKHISAGGSLDETLAMKPSKDFDEKWGKGFMSPDRFLSIVYQTLSQGK
jgi:glyoxylase-like metal-dependent hydrolase (beta-lactamase superfamily II)